MSEKPTDLFGTITIAPGSASEETPAAVPAEKEPRKSRRSRSAREPKTRPPAKRPRPAGSGSWKLWVGLLVVAIGGYCAAGFLLAPYLLRTVLPDYLHKQTGLQLAIKQTHFNPFTFRLDVNGLSVFTEAAGQNPERLLAIDRLDSDLEPISLLRGDLVCKTLTIDGLAMSVIRREDKTYNIAPLLRSKSAPSQTSDIIDFAELPFFFALNNITIGNARVTVEDHHTGKQHLIESIQLTLPAIANFSSGTKTYLQPHFSAVVNGSPITLSSSAAADGTAAQGDTAISVSLNDIDIPLYSDYLPVELPIRFTKGAANGTLHVSFSDLENQGQRLVIRFDLSATELTLQSRDQHLSLTVPSARLEGSFAPLSRTLQLDSVLLHEPTLAGTGPLTRETLATLLPMTRRPAADSTLYQAIPALRIKLLIADGASFVGAAAGDKKEGPAWKDIQLSIRDFSNEAGGKDSGSGTFRLAGVDGRSPASFTWQGQFSGSDNRPAGTLQLSDMPVARIAPFLGRTPTDISGSLDLNGQLSMALAEGAGQPLAYALKSTSITIKELQLKERGLVWLRTPTLRCEPVSISNGVSDFGNVFLPNSTVVMDRAQLPHLFGLFATRPDAFILHGFDFSGTVKVLDNSGKETLLDLRDVLFQANKLELKEIKDDNFVFTARQGDSGSIKAKGILQVAPLTLAAEVATTSLTPKELFSWFSGSKTLLTSRALVDVKGKFRYPQQEFNGELAARQVEIGPAKTPLFRAAAIACTKFNWSGTRNRLEIDTVKTAEPAFSWKRESADENPAEQAAVFLRRLLLPEAEPSDTTQKAAGSDGLSLTIGDIQWSEGRISYRDQRLEPAVQFEILGVHGNLKRLTYPAVEQNAVFQVRGLLDKYPFTIEGEGRLLQKPASVTAGFVAPSVPLHLFAPQIKQRIKDIDIDQANAQVSFSASWQGKQGREQTDIVLRGVTPRTSGSPTAVTLALISDRDGKTSYRTDTEQISGAGVVAEAITHYATLLIKAAIDPLLLADEAFKDLVEQQFVIFQPGTAVITGAGLERLNRYSELLAAHPLIALKLAGHADLQADAPVLLAELTRKEQQRVEEENRKRAEQWQRQQEEKQAAAAQAADPQKVQETDIKPEEEQFVPLAPLPVKVSREMLADLAGKRAQAALTHLVEKLDVDPRRASIHQAKPQIGEDGTFARVDLLLSDMFGRHGDKATP
ncbi:DUF748 domain-containing protein [Desulfofustis limnaeus]|uniref:Flagellar motor protein MotB n=1 Tax=Desulfofustis limnaeus TaxID=2740163 RepID=A0ABM7W7J5_9BACT|nr:DUF748 domain-containing protein [Desulfofustis limnaeus]BDD86872.1 flagellar motor protein MotB [Desulfofustis limnaeus]